MNDKIIPLPWMWSLFLAGACGIAAEGPSSDALLNKLVEKGVLTSKEASDLRRETQQGAAVAGQAKSGLPDWVTSLKFNGDFRARYEAHYISHPDFVDRNRYRYRVRLGAVATLHDDFEIGLRLTSGDPVGGFSNNAGNPLSGSTTFQDNGTRKFVYLDLAYAKWSPLHSDDWSGSMTFGKMELPFVFSHVLFDPDYTPEGLAGQFGYKLTDKHSLRLNAGAFVLDEITIDSDDPLLLGAQVRLDSKWSSKIATSAGVAVLAVMGDENLSNTAVPNVNRGNTRQASGIPAYNFNPIIGDLSLTYTMDHIPGYKGAFPIKVGGEALHNPAAPSKNNAFSAGVTFGKAGKKGLWEVSYQYRYIEADSWYEEFPDDDFGGYYAAQQPNSGFTGVGAGFGGGTNVKGHVVKANYSAFDSLTFGLIYYYGDLIDRNPSGLDGGATHLMVDAVWKF